MSNSQSSNPAIAKLLEADADLVAQEAQLSAQLQSIREKRHSLKTVIDMFAPVDTATTPIATSAQPEAVATQQEESTSLAPSPVEVVTGLEPDGTNVDATEAPITSQSQKQKAKKNSSPASSKQSKKSAPAEKQSKAPDTWQQYVKDEFSTATLAEAVAQVMQQHQKKVVAIATIIDTIFTSNIPKEVRSTARERVSNILSVGAKSGKWYRGQLGKYSVSKSAIKG